MSLSDFEAYVRRSSAGENITGDDQSLEGNNGGTKGKDSSLSTGSHLRLPHQRRGAAKAAINARSVLQDNSKSVDLTGFDDLPVAESAYTTDAPMSAPVELPPWASARQRNALREIKKTQKKRKQGEKKGNDRKKGGDLTRESGGNSRQSLSASTPSRTNECSPKKDHKLNLQGIAADASALVAEKLQIEKDEVLHIDSGVVMTFRVVVGAGRDDLNRKNEEVDSLRYRDILEENRKILQPDDDNDCKDSDMHHHMSMDSPAGVGFSTSVSSLETAKGTQPMSTANLDRWLPFTLILVPDIFMTLETLHKAFEPILVKYPMARLILIGPPGNPYTHWPRGWILNADLQSRSVLSILLHLKEKNRVGNKSDPIFVMGFGTGAHSLSRFVSLFLPALSWMQKRIKAVVIVNGFIHISKGFKRVCKDLRGALMLANPSEVAELVSSIHFSEDYMSSHDRKATQKAFWSSRRGLCTVNQNDLEQTKLQAGKAYTGVLEQLRGLLIGPDVLSQSESFLSSTNIPLFVVQGTDDVFVSPAEVSMAYSAKNVSSTGRDLVSGVLEGLVPGSVHISWLKCGHEILVERPSYLLALISNFIQEVRFIPEDKDDEEINFGYQDEMDPVELARLRREAAAKEQQRLAMEKQEKLEAEAAEKARVEEEEREIERQRAQFEMELQRDREIALRDEQAKLEAEAAEREHEATIRKEKEEMAQKAAKKEREKASRLEAMAERKRREAKEARKAELSELYETQRLYNERKSEAYELSRMALEDERSADLRVYSAECEAAEMSAHLAREKVQDLFAGRREDAMRKIEEKLALERAQRLEKRRMDADANVRLVEEQESVFMDTSKYTLLEVPGDDFYVGDPNNLEAEEAAEAAKRKALDGLDLSRAAIADAIANTHTIFKDYMSCRQKLIESMKRQKLVEQKTILFRNQKDELEADIRKLQRALRLFVKGSLASELGATSNELNELKSTLEDKENTMAEFVTIGRDKENHLASANRSVQQLKVSLVDVENILSKQLASLQTVESEQTNKARRLKFTKENELIARDKHITSQNMIKLRLDIIRDEYVRIKAHKEEFVDSNVLFDGFLQRCVTKTLKKHLKLEKSKWEERISAIGKDIASCQSGIDAINDKQVTCKLDLDKLSMALKYFFRGFNKAKQLSVVDEVTEALFLQENAGANEARRADERENMSHAELVQLLVGKESSGLAAKTRKKPLDLRTKEDRKFIGLDLILHPEEYLNVNITEAEEMKFDPDYQCDLKKSDLERIEKLPELIALAMPFLHTKTEVSAHRLINMYYRDQGDEFFSGKDFLSYGHGDNGSTNDNASSALSADTSIGTSVGHIEMSQADIVHEILVKEFRRDRVRTIVRFTAIFLTTVLTALCYLYRLAMFTKKKNLLLTRWTGCSSTKFCPLMYLNRRSA